jgi:hypothetical protein
VLTGHRIHTQAIAKDGSATVGVLVEADLFATGAQLTKRVEVTAPSGRRTTVDLSMSNGQARDTVTVGTGDHLVDDTLVRSAVTGRGAPPNGSTAC